MKVTIPDVMRHVRNHIVTARLSGAWQTEKGKLSPNDHFDPGAWIAIQGGPLRGVHQLDEFGAIPGAEDAVWVGIICLLQPPADFLRLCGEIAAWAAQHEPGLTSERFGEYSRTLAHTDWRRAFSPALAPYMRMYSEVKL